MGQQNGENGTPAPPVEPNADETETVHTTGAAGDGGSRPLPPPDRPAAADPVDSEAAPDAGRDADGAAGGRAEDAGAPEPAAAVTAEPEPEPAEPRDRIPEQPSAAADEPRDRAPEPDDGAEPADGEVADAGVADGGVADADGADEPQDRAAEAGEVPRGAEEPAEAPEPATAGGPESPATVSLGGLAEKSPMTVSLGKPEPEPAPATVSLGKVQLPVLPAEEHTPVQPLPVPAPISSAEAPTAASRLLSGRYRLGTVVGRGGMGTVWRANDEMLGRAVAVKELRLPANVDDAERRRLITRTLREAKAIATIRNRGVVTVFDVVDEGARPWIVMELIEGRSLADVIRDDGPLTPKRTAEIGLAVLDVLSAAHRAGIVHRDVKPSNVLIADADGRVVLTDFGIAKVEGDPSITSTGMLVGAPSYISPERARGDELGPPADFWSLGALLYCSVEGHPPYDRGGAISTLAAVMNDPLEIPASAGPLAEVIAGLLLKDPADRFDEPVTRALLRDAIGNARKASGRSGTVATGLAAVGSAPIAEPAAGAAPRTPPPAPAPPLAGGTPAHHPALPGDVSAAASRPDATPPHPQPQVSPSAAGEGGGGASNGGADGGRSRKKLAMLVGGAVVVLALLGLLLVTQLGGGDDDEPASDTSTEPESPAESTGEGEPGGADEGATGGEDTGEPAPDPSETDQDPTDGGGDDPGPEPDPSGPPVTSPEREPGFTLPPPGTPSGFSQQLNLSYRFSMAFPIGWQQTGTAGQNSGAIYSEANGGPPKIQVDFTDSPSGDARQAWLELEDSVRQGSTDYERISIEAVDWRGYPTVADWEFQRSEDGDRVRVLNRGFQVGDEQGYAIMVTCVASEWDGNDCRTLRETAFATFLPLE